MGLDASIEIKGIRPPDEEWRKMKAVWDSCSEAEVDIPEAVEKYFHGDEPDERGICIDIAKTVHENVDDSMSTGIRNGNTGNYYLIDVRDIPKNVTHLKVWLSWG